jgi:hypothetical protein
VVVEVSTGTAVVASVSPPPTAVVVGFGRVVEVFAGTDEVVVVVVVVLVELEVVVPGSVAGGSGTVVSSPGRPCTGAPIEMPAAMIAPPAASDVNERRVGRCDRVEGEWVWDIVPLSLHMK